MKCGSMGRIYFLGSSASIVWKNFEGVELQGWRSIWRGKVETFLGAINALQIYKTTSYVSSKGSESGRRHKGRNVSSSAKHDTSIRWWRWGITGDGKCFKAWSWVLKKGGRALWA
jgi:hypothetical protein